MSEDKQLIYELFDKEQKETLRTVLSLIIPANEDYKMPSANDVGFFSYIEDANAFINIIKSKINNDGSFVIRQYDGATMRFGPMSYEDRNYIEDSLFNAVGDSKQFRHYDIDRIYEECLTYGGEMDYKTYLDFVLALENRKEPQALAYCFRILGKYILHFYLIPSFESHSCT